MSKNRQINKETGLTPSQENAVYLLLTGKSISEVAEELKLTRGTLYNWQEKENFQAYYNKVAKKLQGESESKLLGLQIKALQTLEDCLDSENDHTRVKAAQMIIEASKELEFGFTDPREIIESKCRIDHFDDFNQVDEDKRDKLLKRNNLLAE